MFDLLFAPPWWLPVCIGFVGAILFYQGNRTQNAGQRNTGIGIVLATILLVILAWLIDTPLEKVTKATKQLAASAGSGDWTTFGSLLDSQVSFNDYRSKPVLLNGAQLSAAAIGLKSVTITGMDLKRSADLIIVNMRCLSVQDRTMGQSVFTDWQLDWRETDGHWLLYHAEPLQNENIGPKQIEQNLLR